jgi:hypothetical protein
MSTVPLLTSGMRFCEVTAWCLTFQRRHAELLHRVDDAVADVDVVADRLLPVVEVGQRPPDDSRMPMVMRRCP